MDTTSQANLTRLLSKLSNTLLGPVSAENRKLSSPYERSRINSNIEYARTLLLTLEKQSATIRVQSQRQAIQADLHNKRETIKRLQARLEELSQVDEDDEDDDEEDANNDANNGASMNAPSYAPARTDTQSGLDTGEPPGPRISPAQQQELRSRKPLQASDNRSAATTTAREQLFAGRPTQPAPDLQRTEALMSHNRTEQENLSSSLIALAQSLKQSSLQFSSSLEAEKDVLKRAEGGLDKSAQGMEAAERRMSLLRRMTEGQGWWGRIKLYAFVFGLWLVAFLLVFVVPKLR